MPRRAPQPPRPDRPHLWVVDLGYRAVRVGWIQPEAADYAGPTSIRVHWDSGISTSMRRDLATRWRSTIEPKRGRRYLVDNLVDAGRVLGAAGHDRAPVEVWEQALADRLVAGR